MFLFPHRILTSWTGSVTWKNIYMLFHLCILWLMETMIMNIPLDKTRFVAWLRLWFLFFSKTKLQCFTDPWGVSSLRFLTVHSADYDQNAVDMGNCGVSSFATMCSVYTCLDVHVQPYTGSYRQIIVTACSWDYCCFPGHNQSSAFFFFSFWHFLSSTVCS